MYRVAVCIKALLLIHQIHQYHRSHCLYYRHGSYSYARITSIDDWTIDDFLI